MLRYLSGVVGFTGIANSAGRNDFQRRLWIVRGRKGSEGDGNSFLHWHGLRGWPELPAENVEHGCSAPTTDHPVRCPTYPTSGALSPVCQISILGDRYRVQGDTCTLHIDAAQAADLGMWYMRVKLVCHAWAKGQHVGLVEYIL